MAGPPRAAVCLVNGPLCSACWEALGHCGHPEAEQANEDTRRASTLEERHTIMNRRGETPKN
jgi:hypothetical protein